MTANLQGVDIILRLTDPTATPASCRQALLAFAHDNGWKPSDRIDEYRGTEELANGHILVEHGLANAAVLSFLKSTYPYSTLDRREKVQLLTLSYNHLVDWHLFPDQNGLTVVYNRSSSLSPRRISIDEDPNVWRAESFAKITSEQPNPNLPGLDDALVKMLSDWKRKLPLECEGATVGNDNISALFNAILFIRALEDYRRNPANHQSQVLLTTWDSQTPSSRSIRNCLFLCFREFGVEDQAELLGISQAKLAVFDSLDYQTTLELFRDFYQGRTVPYRYDFSVISKHALSRIYEHYVSLLREKDSPQLTLFAELPDEISNRSVGGIYTPQFVARFFARFLKENHTPASFRRIRTCDPACGSGIFLRTLLEMQCDPLQEVEMSSPTREAFDNALGIDVDENACNATRLSLSLLHLVLTGHPPPALKIFNSEAIEHYQNDRALSRSFDAVIANPPFIKWDNMSPQLRQRVRNFIGGSGRGKLDLFLAFLKLGLDLVKPGGYLLYVLPHSFLLTNSARALRKEIGSGFWVRLLADLSEIPVFEDTGAYVVLLIVQRRQNELLQEPMATVVQCRDYVGHALQAALENKAIKTDLYSVFDMKQSNFDPDGWRILSPIQMRLMEKLRKFPKLERFLEIREGMVTGADDLFIMDRAAMPKGESRIFRPFLSDKSMRKYRTPASTSRVVFYPYIGDDKLTEERMKSEFPKMWKYLKSNAHRLKARESVKSGNAEWWCPVRPRPPKRMMRPKIVTPHLVLFPRFSLDGKGRYAVSHCPLLYPKDSTVELDILCYFLAVLNSSIAHWQITQFSHKYRSGYLMLEPKTLKKLHVPDPSHVPMAAMRKIRRLLETCTNRDTNNQDQELDRAIADLYALSENERVVVGLEE